MLLQTLKYWKSFVLTAIICYLSFAQPSEFEKIPKIKIEHLDKIVHIIMYFALTLTLLYEHKFHLKILPKVALYISYPILLGGCIEIAQQSWFYPRTGEWVDWLADILGTILALLIVYTFNKLKAKHEFREP